MKAFLEQIRALGTKRLAALGGVALATIALLAWFAFRAGEPAMAPLYSDLDPREAGQIVATLDRQRVGYRLAAGGTRILVAEADVPKLRLMLAREGLPSGGGVGWEIFDRGESLTTTPFQQDVNRLRALEGELARTIRGLAFVRAARVHLVLPKREPFSRERAEAQASVILTMQGSQRLDREGTQAVLHLVATAVPGLKPQNVSIVDSRGELLARGGEALSGPAAAASQDEVRRAQEMRLARSVEEMLERSLGAGKVRAEATVEMDFDRVQTTEERFDPENQVPRSTQSTNEQNRTADGGSVSVANQLPGADANGGGARTQENRQEETTNFEIGKTTRQTLREHPMVRRLSLAVLVDGVMEPGAEGKPAQYRDRTAEELARLTTLVQSAVGYDQRRGDKVEVVSMRFVPPEGGSPEPMGFLNTGLGPSSASKLIESTLFAIVALVAILVIGRPMTSRLIASLAPRAALTGPNGETVMLAADGTALPAQPGLTALPGTSAVGPDGEPLDEGMVSLSMVEGQMRASSIVKLIQLIEKHPDETIAVVRSWLAPEEG
ncbi:flagellar M-ring protein FliF [Acetobacteraceae bacterium H6797]|nr:flagellar M-ring protein FliF [Acetobacteraceae bacterium H6797]